MASDISTPTSRSVRLVSTGETQPLIGNECHLYADDMSNWAAPVHDASTLIDEAADVNLSDWSLAEVEVVTRAADWAVNLTGKFRAALEFQYLYGANWPIWSILQTAWMSRIPLAWWIADLEGSTAKAQGLRMPGYIVQFPMSEGVEDAVMHDTIRVVPAYAVDGTDVRILPVWFLEGGPVLFSEIAKTLTPFQIAKLEAGKLQVRAEGKVLQGEALFDALKIPKPSDYAARKAAADQRALENITAMRHRLQQGLRTPPTSVDPDA